MSRLRPRVQYQLLRWARLPAAVLRRRWVRCACCGAVDAHYAPFHGRTDIVCRRCGAQERQRALALVVGAVGIPRGACVLHLAPERERFLAATYRAAGAQVVTLDIAPPAAVLGDLQRLPVADASVDVVVCSHVLEHVPDDRAGLAELFRVLRPGGVAFVLVPVHHKMQQTYTDPDAVTPEQQQVAHWWAGHLRLYGLDFFDLVRGAGFDVEERQPTAQLGGALQHRLGVPEHERVYLARKPG